MWQEEYLLSLREKLPLEHKQPRSQNLMEPKEGSIVIVKDKSLPRSNWKVGRILRLIPSSDSRVRSAEIQLPGESVISRAINHLYPLELTQSDQGQSIKARKTIYDSLKDDCSAILFCVPQECHGDLDSTSWT